MIWCKEMYKKQERNELYLEGFKMQFGGKLRTDNRWVKMAKLIPWDVIEEIYASNFSENSGATAIDSRIAFGALIVYDKQKLTDRETVEYIAENPYVQYFLGLKEFTDKRLFDPSMMVHFRKRFPADEIDKINRLMFEQRQEVQTPDNDEAEKDKSDDNNDNTPSSGTSTIIPPSETASSASANKGKLVLDATCAPADIRYPNDLSLLNEGRENLETIIDELWEYGDKKGQKTRYRRKKARKEYLSLAKQKQPKQAKIKKAISKQLQYIKKNIDMIGTLLIMSGIEVLPEKRINRIMTICELHRQQLYMNKSNTRSCENRIISLRQPHIRAIVRGKAGKRYEFGQKIALSVINGYTFIEKQSYDNFNEGIRLIESVERYKEHCGYYPEAVLADKIYRNRENLSYCKNHGIRLSGPKLGRPKLDADTYEKELIYKDNCERNIVEGRIGTAKRRYGLGLILPYLPETALTDAALQILCMNIAIRINSFYAFLLRSFYTLILDLFCVN